MHDEMARGLGYFSIALGIAELAMPRAIRRAAGIEATGRAGARLRRARDRDRRRDPDDARRDAVDLGPGRRRRARHRDRRARPARLARRRPQEAVGARRPGSPSRRSICSAPSASAREKGGRRTARADYRNRSGFPQGPQAARGAARDFQTPRDIRGPEALRPQTTEGARHPAAPSGEWVTSRFGST